MYSQSKLIIPTIIKALNDISVIYLSAFQFYYIKTCKIKPYSERLRTVCPSETNICTVGQEKKKSQSQTLSAERLYAMLFLFSVF